MNICEYLLFINKGHGLYKVETHFSIFASWEISSINLASNTCGSNLFPWLQCLWMSPHCLCIIWQNKNQTDNLVFKHPPTRCSSHMTRFDPHPTPTHPLYSALTNLSYSQNTLHSSSPLISISLSIWEGLSLSSSFIMQMKYHSKATHPEKDFWSE